MLIKNRLTSLPADSSRERNAPLFQRRPAVGTVLPVGLYRFAAVRAGAGSARRGDVAAHSAHQPDDSQHGLKIERKERKDSLADQKALPAVGELLGLVVAVVFVMLVMFTACFAHVLLRVGVERLLAARSAEVIRLPLVLGLAGRGGGVNLHAANGIVYRSHRSAPFLF